MSPPDTGTPPSRERAEVRRHNLHLLLKDFEKEKDLAERAGIEPSYLSQIKSGRPAIGEEIARRIEAAAGKPSGWMDEDRRPKGIRSGGERGHRPTLLKEESAAYKIALISLRFADELEALTLPDDAAPAHRAVYEGLKEMLLANLRES